MIWLFIFVLAISLYDLHTRRVPNWCTLPLLIAGLLFHFPGQLNLWISSSILLAAWINNGIGAGDLKLWLAVLWSLPTEFSSQVLPLMFLSFFLTGTAQILWRAVRKQAVINHLQPGAWRLIPFLLLVLYVH